MALSISSQRLDKVTVLTCSGRIVQGPESESLRQHVSEALKNGPFIVLHFGGVDFVDSSGLALLVRLMERTRSASGSLKLCATSGKITEVLRITRLENILESFPTVDEAIAAFGRPAPAPVSIGPPPDVLCVDSSAEMLAYLRELLRQAGYAAITADNVPDALKLLRTTHPKVVAVGAVVSSDSDTHARDAFYALARSRGLIELPENFSTHEAAAVGRDLVDQVRMKLAVSSTADGRT
jgi:anti-anti-sigma factor